MGRLIAVIIGFVIYGIVRLIGGIFSSISDKIHEPERKRAEEETQKLEEERRKQRQDKYRREHEERTRQHNALIEKYKNLTIEEILLRNELSNRQKQILLDEIHKYNWNDSEELIKTAERAQKKARLDVVKRKVTQKAQEIYGNIPVDDTRKPISDDVKMFVWQRDQGKCVKCDSQENLEFDHIIPVVKGGSSTERNIQLLCEKCNRSKSDEVC